MKVGISTFITDEGIRPTVLAAAVEERGFDALFFPEHSHIPVSRATPFPFGDPLPRAYYRAWDPFVALAAAATATSKLLLGTGVALLIQRDVIHTAKEIASLDHLSGGRVIFGVGSGWNREEMRNHGTDPRTRAALLDEQIEALQVVWTTDEAAYHGKFIEFDPIFQWPKPVQRPHPPIYVGGNSAAALRRAARFGAGWMPIARQEASDVREQRALLTECDAPDVPVTAALVRRDPGLLAQYADCGTQRATLFLPVKSESDSLRTLDELAAIAKEFL